MDFLKGPFQVWSSILKGFRSTRYFCLQLSVRAAELVLTFTQKFKLSHHKNTARMTGLSSTTDGFYWLWKTDTFTPLIADRGWTRQPEELGLKAGNRISNNTMTNPENWKSLWILGSKDRRAFSPEETPSESWMSNPSLHKKKTNFTISMLPSRLQRRTSLVSQLQTLIRGKKQQPSVCADAEQVSQK